jgi:hypothetical protein
MLEFVMMDDGPMMAFQRKTKTNKDIDTANALQMAGIQSDRCSPRVIFKEREMSRVNKSHFGEMRPSVFSLRGFLRHLHVSRSTVITQQFPESNKQP